MNVTGRRLTASIGAGVLSVTLAGALVLSGAVGAYDGPNEGVPHTGYTGTAKAGDVDCWSDVTCERTARGLTPEPNEDEAGWNCLTMGNEVCGPAFVPVSQELGDALAEGDDATAATRDWESCLVNEGDTSYIVCPDGYTETS